MSSPSPINSLISKIITTQPTISRNMAAQIGELKLSEYLVLDRLGYVHGFKMRGADLAKATGLTPGAITKIVQSLEKRGLIARESDARDARTSRIYRTYEGSKSVCKAQDQLKVWGNKICNFASEDEMYQAEQIVTRLADALGHTWWYGEIEDS